ncbi:MAG: ABC transporter ATP-binding protein [Thermodesulfobacteriota bacterium]
MKEIAIQVENLGKLYRIRQARTRHDTLRDKIVDLAKLPFRRLESSGRVGERRPLDVIWALKGVSFEVEKGEILGVIGGNGAGKTTLLRILSRITEPTEGYAEIRGRVGTLLEVGTGFHPELTGRENIYLNGAILGMRKSEIDRKFDEIVAFAEMEKFLDTPVKRYSSGMYVRLAFAVAAHLEAEILLVDEVLAVGDAAFQKKCLGKMGDVAKKGRTVVFVSHNMAAIQGICSRCCLLDEGQLVAEGPPRDVIEQYLVNLLEVTSISLDERKDRKGSAEIKFTDVSIIDAHGRTTNSVFSGQDVAIAISYRSRDGKPVSNLDVHITFFTILGQFLFNCSSESSGYYFNAVPAQGRFICYIPELPLAPGRYTFNIFATVKGEIADWVQQAGCMNVVAGDYFGTGQLKTHPQGFLVKNKWEYDGCRENGSH